jgi:peptide/nickel transport system permease protein
VLRFTLQRLILLPVLLFLFSIIVFVLIQAPPGDYLDSYIATLASSGSSVDEEQIQALKTQFGLDQPIHVQYVRWIENILRGDLGLSLEYQRSNNELIGERLMLTVVLALFAFAFTWIVAIPAGILCAMHPHSFIDYFFSVLNSPEYVDAPWSLGKWANLLSHIWLPMVVIGIAGTARLTRVMRANLLDELNKPYVVTARAKGLSEWRLVMKYPVRLAINPLVSTIGWYLPQLFSGSLIVATVMNLPNIGPLLLRALTSQDMYLAGSILLIYCALTIIGTLISDILLALIDPRIRMGGARA